MRDVSHQSIGEEINGHGRQNLNMMTKFVENISESKDWCSYWEINRHNLPAPVDYTSDQDFWYNLNANFDVLNACYRLYLWTGNKTYIDDPRFECFFRLTLNEYVEKWQLQADRIMQRPALMNVYPASEGSRFRENRGIPSYEEAVHGIRVSGDLISVIYRGYNAYADIIQIKGDTELSALYRQKAEAYRQLYDSVWWNPNIQEYYAYYLDSGVFGEVNKKSGSNVMSAWFGSVSDPDRITSILKYMSERKTGTENKTYYPMTYYRYGMSDEAYHYLNDLFTDDRRDYPEVASGMIEGIVSGLAGIQPDAVSQTVRTCPRLTSATQWVSIENIPTFAGPVSVSHLSPHKTSFANKTDKEIIWQASFPGDYSVVSYNGISENAKKYTDEIGNIYSYINITVKPGTTVTAKIPS